MKKRIMAWVLALCMGVPVCAGAAQEQEVYGYPTEDALRKLPKTVTRGDFLEALASASGEDVSDSAWIDMEEYFTDGVEASDEVKWTFAKWILNGAAQDGEKAVLRLDHAAGSGGAARTVFGLSIHRAPRGLRHRFARPV